MPLYGNSEYDYCYTCSALQERISKLEEALRLIATPKRPDGTYNRNREACEQLANEALLKTA